MSQSRKLVGRYLERRDFLKLGGTGVIGAAVLGACGTAGSRGSSFPTRPIQIIVGAPAGGETDSGARILQPYLEKELGTSLTIVNKPGAGTWLSALEIIKAEPDGYTIGFINDPHLQAAYLNPNFDRDYTLHDLTPIANQVTDYSAIGVRTKRQKFKTIGELIEHARRKELTTTTTGVGGDDELVALALNDKFGTKFKPVRFDGTSEGVASVLGGHTDVLFANVGGQVPLADEGNIDPLCVIKDDEQRSDYLPKAPTLKEAGYPGIEFWSSRGLAGPANMDPKVLDVLTKACASAIRNPEHVKKMARQGLQVDLSLREKYLNKILKPDEKRVRRLGDKYVW